VKRHVAALLVLVATPAGAQEAEIRAAFDDYRASIAAKDWTKASQYIDTETARQFEHLATVTLRADKDTLLREPFWIAATAIALRTTAKASDLRDAQGRELYAVANRLSGFTSLDPSIIDIGQIRAEGDGRAAAQVVHQGQVTEYRMGFVREDGHWRIAWQPLFARAAEDMQSQIGITPRTPADVRALVIERDLLPGLQELSGKPISFDIWQPLEGRAP
jgi:hypothetical protein